MSAIRALHWVFKIGDRTQTAKFYREILGMKVLRHEEFKEGCAAACNGPYDNRWSKTMIGYGPESNHFVIELTYNYNVFDYERGNEFLGITIKSKEALGRARAANWPVEQVGNKYKLEAPGGYPFYLLDEPQPTDSDPVVEVSLASSSLNKTLDYWNKLLKAEIFSKESGAVVVGFNKDHCKIRFVEKTDGPIDRKLAYGRIAFAIPGAELKSLEEKMKAADTTILTPYVKLDTPGKASVVVVILADPDGHEICFVDEEGFSELSQYNPEEEKILDRFIAKEAKDRPDIRKQNS
ncbi:glyoxalase domain containing 4 [Nesidiocoris tenuis]|uniref:Glyoxalase domain containing 4 n=1 Tax=Nesidiocoris tenuis TaxID=355587 RepID=A0ABN7AZ78_9HEMI|nr:glyoxalase domain containing 4 [Nesidiocoris tenuis]